MKNEVIIELIKMALGSKECTADLIAQPQTSYENPLLCKHVVVRARNAGVHIGTYKANVDGCILLEKSNRIWQWEGSFTLSDVSQNGIKRGRVGVEVENLLIRLQDIGEILNLTENAREKIIKHIESKMS
ncbi:MAG: hypothetical protein HRT70_10910 [Flavobacteriaceae bacterium]|nr:hypothetical protein [Flavobacteriaceae bacterium]